MLTMLSTWPYKNSIQNNFVGEKSHCMHRQITARCAFACMIPLSLQTSLIDTIIGIGSYLATPIITVASNSNKSYWFASGHLQNCSKIISNPFVFLLKTINPKANATHFMEDHHTSGYITYYVKEKLQNKAHNMWWTSEWESHYGLKKHLVTRAIYVGLALLCPITRIVDGVLGVIGATFALLSFGTIKSLNNFAYRGLQIPGIIFDLVDCTINFFNPHFRHRCISFEMHDHQLYFQKLFPTFNQSPA